MNIPPPILPTPSPGLHRPPRKRTLSGKNFKKKLLVKQMEEELRTQWKKKMGESLFYFLIGALMVSLVFPEAIFLPPLFFFLAIIQVIRDSWSFQKNMRLVRSPSGSIKYKGKRNKETLEKKSEITQWDHLDQHLLT